MINNQIRSGIHALLLALSLATLICRADESPWITLLVDETNHESRMAFEIHSVGGKPNGTQSVIRLKNIRVINDQPERFARPMSLPPRSAPTTPGLSDKAAPKTASASQSAAAQSERLIVLADMGNEPDEEQRMLHLLMCANEFEVAGLIAVTGKYLRPEDKNPYRKKLHPELFIKLNHRNRCALNRLPKLNRS